MDDGACFVNTGKSQVWLPAGGGEATSDSAWTKPYCLQMRVRNTGCSSDPICVDKQFDATLMSEWLAVTAHV